MPDQEQSPAPVADTRHARGYDADRYGSPRPWASAPDPLFAAGFVLQELRNDPDCERDSVYNVLATLKNFTEDDLFVLVLYMGRMMVEAEVHQFGNARVEQPADTALLQYYRHRMARPGAVGPDREQPPAGPGSAVR